MNKQHPVLLSDPTRIIFYNVVGGKYALFGSFSEVLFVYRNIKWRSAEHAYQAMKFYYATGTSIDDKLFEHYESIVNAPNAIEARKLGKDRRLPIRHDWNTSGRSCKVKSDFMFDIVMEKVTQNQEILELLMGTGEQGIIQSDANEAFWGIGKDGNGENMLGKIYMMVRRHIKEKQRKKVVEEFS